jgi:hypothetical protein
VGLFNRRKVFAWVAAEGLPAIATGDVHCEDHVSSWKTLLPCEKEEQAIVSFLRSDGRASLVPFSVGVRAVASAAAAA